MKKIFLSLVVFISMTANIVAQNIGIGTTTPKAALNVADGKTVLFGADVTGAGLKLIWYPTLGSLVAGKSFSTEFDFANVGYSAIALGYANAAKGDYSVGIGSSNTATGTRSLALGYSSQATGYESAAIGRGAVASGITSFSFGNSAKAIGNYSTAIGSYASSYGISAFTLGNNVVATGDNSTAMGINTNTNNHTNSFCIGGSGVQTSNSADNQMMMRFDNYTFWVSASNYAYLVPASNGWAYTSDINKKENFLELNGDTVLKKISTIPFYSWNFKANDTRQYRHYGIMAQHFYNAFGKDDYGNIGNDTTVSPLDLLGVAYSGIKALEKRTAVLQKENKEMAEAIASFKMMKAEMDKLRLQLKSIQQKIK